MEEEESSGSDSPMILSDGMERVGYLSHLNLLKYYNFPDASGFDCETVSSISRLSAITDAILLSHPSMARGILSFDPPHADEESIERPCHPPIRSVVTKEIQRIVPSEHVCNQIIEKEDASISISKGTEKIPALRWNLWRRAALVLFVASLAGALAIFLPTKVGRSDRSVNSTDPNEQSSNVTSVKDDSNDDTTIRTSPPAPNGFQRQFPTQSPNDLLVPKSPQSDSPVESPTENPSIQSPSPMPTLVHTASPTSREDTILSTLSSMSVFDSSSIALNNSPQNLAYKFLLDTTRFDVHGPDRIIQRYGMAVLYFSTLGTSWEHNEGWITEENECHWYNQDTHPCNSEGMLVRLKLQRNNLLGELPEEVGLLQNIIEIDVGGNDIFGQIPVNLGDLNHLQVLDLSWTNLDGGIPESLGYASSLQHINVIGTSLSGQIPVTIGGLTHLKTLLLARNNLFGALPSTVCDLPGLQEVWADCDLVSCPCCNYCCYRLDAIETCQYV